MKIINNNIEQQIKKQIQEREIAPTRDLWSEIETQSTAKPLKSSFNQLLIAACLILTFSLGAVFFFNRENKPVEHPETLAQEIKPAVQSTVENIAPKQTSELMVKSRDRKATVENRTADKKDDLKEQQLQILTQQDELSAVKQNSAQVILEISPIKPGKAIAQIDSSKIQVKKKRYVDPSTLLFSVEHKEVIEKTKGKSNVATIDLNGN